jgi:ubiquinol-cytochrome c reductase subunit 7
MTYTGSPRGIAQRLLPSYTIMRMAKGPVLIPHRADDLIPEESETVLLALKRLPQKEAYDRVFRLRRAFQVSVVICSSWD